MLTFLETKVAKEIFYGAKKKKKVFDILMLMIKSYQNKSKQKLIQSIWLDT